MTSSATKNLAIGLLIGLAAAASFSLPASAASLAGKWKRPNGVIVQFAPCGSGFCATALTGPNAGKSVGKLSPAGDNSFKGSLTDPSAGKTYKGTATLSGGSLNMQGCVVWPLCKSETWSKQ